MGTSKGLVVFFILILTVPCLIATKSVFAQSTTSSFTDNFDSSTLGSEWHVIDDAGGSTFDLSANPGWLRINTTEPPSRDLRVDAAVSNTIAPRITLSGVSDDFTIETKIMCTLSNVGQGAGILVWYDNTQFVWFGVAEDYQLVPTFHFGITSGISSIGGYNASNPIYLKLTRNGSLFDAYFSSDGARWIPYDSLHWDYYVPHLSPRPVDVGLYVKDPNYNNSGSFSADFDYFNMTLTAAPSPTASPTQMPTTTPSPTATQATASASATPKPSPKQTPTIPEFPMSTVLLLFLPILSIALILRHQKTRVSKQNLKDTAKKQ